MSYWLNSPASLTILLLLNGQLKMSCIFKAPNIWKKNVITLLSIKLIKEASQFIAIIIYSHFINILFKDDKFAFYQP